MVAILTSWIVISFILLSFGDMGICFYNNLCNRDEKYNLPDTFLLGMCFILIPLSFTSLWLPSNHYMLFAYICITIIYWACNKGRLVLHLQLLASRYQSLTIMQKVLIITSAFSMFLYLLWSSSFFDPAFYHYHNTRWNEEFGVVPGLANIEDRFGFNSNYLLLSAVFSLRFLFGQPIYGLQGLLFVYMFWWALFKLFSSKSNMVSIVLVLFFLLFVLTNRTAFADSDTDIIPNLCIFYILLRGVTEPEQYAQKPLLIGMLLASLVTFKLSSGIFCLLCISPIYYLIKEKQYRPIIFISTAALLIVGLWLVRNVFISGYLIYPLYQIDLFAVDWKLPQSTAKMQQRYIYDWAANVYSIKLTFGKIWKDWAAEGTIELMIKLIAYCSFIFAVASPIFFLYSLFKSKRRNVFIYLPYFICLLSFVFWFKTAPDFRFISGAILGCCFITIYSVLDALGKTKNHLPKFGYLFSVAAVVSIFIFSLMKNYSYMAHTDFYRPIANKSLAQIGKALLYKPSLNFYCFSRAEDQENPVDEYLLDDIIVYRHKDKVFPHYIDKLLVVGWGGTPFNIFEGGKVQDITTIEMRGKTIQEGFRTKHIYIDVLNNNAEKYLDEYSKNLPWLRVKPKN